MKVMIFFSSSQQNLTFYSVSKWQNFQFFLQLFDSKIFSRANWQNLRFFFSVTNWWNLVIFFLQHLGKNFIWRNSWYFFCKQLAEFKKKFDLFFQDQLTKFAIKKLLTDEMCDFSTWPLDKICNFYAIDWQNLWFFSVIVWQNFLFYSAFDEILYFFVTNQWNLRFLLWPI